MVYAVKSYNNNRPYRRAEDSNILSVIKKTFSKKEEKIEQRDFIDKSIQNLAVNSIIEGYFPKENVVRQMAIKKVNKLLCVAIATLVSIVIISYYFVISCEIKLNNLSRETIILNNENSELQNKLDQLKSFDNVDKTLQQNNMLQKAGQVIETPEITVSTDVNKKSKSKKLFNYAIGF